jgi:hypothetical protein
LNILYSVPYQARANLSVNSLFDFLFVSAARDLDMGQRLFPFFVVDASGRVSQGQTLVTLMKSPRLLFRGRAPLRRRHLRHSGCALST